MYYPSRRCFPLGVLPRLGVVALFAFVLTGCGGGDSPAPSGPAPPPPAPPAPPAAQVIVSTGGDHNCGVTTAGAAYCWGFNNLSQLGDGTNTNSNVPVRVDPPF